jgi:hypothetical protein
MTITGLRNRLSHSPGALRYMIRKHLSRANRESIYFLTLHKCASTLFSDFILKNIIGLRHIDYA